MNKIKIGFVLCMALCFSFGLVACGDGGEGAGGGGGHTHAYTVKNATEKYWKSAADCENPAQYFYACECGEKGTEPYFYGEPLGHDYIDGVCDVCDEVCLHTETEWKTETEAGCVADGTKHSVCVECKEIIEDGSIAATGHDFAEGTCKNCNADLWDGEADVSWYTGDKTEYFIYTAEQLAGVSKLSAEGNTFENVKLTLGANIDLAQREWTPIGTNYTNWFMGTFDGKGLSISNMKITTVQDCVGLFGRVAPNGRIEGVKLYGADINVDSGYMAVGGLVGACTGAVENCGVTGKISVGATISMTDGNETCNVGGAFGTVINANNVFADCEVKNVYADVPNQVNVTRKIGGFAGTVSNAENCYALGDVIYDCQAEIDYDDNYYYQTETWAMIGGFVGSGTGTRNCYAKGDVTAAGTFMSYVGGFSGAFSGTAASCYSTGDVTVNTCDNALASGYTGGFIGDMSVGNSGMVYACYATGEVVMNAKGSSDAGGLIGRNNVSSVNVGNSYATGNVTLVGGRQCAAGGLIGRNNTGTVENAYATGNVTITNTDKKATTTNYMITCEAGGLIGKTEGSVSNAYATGDVTATAYSDAEARVYAYAGGLIGYISEYSEKVTVSNTYASGDVSLTVRATSGNHHSYPAGLIAYLDYAKVSHSFATGNVQRIMNTEGGGCYISPLVGKNVAGVQRKVESCYVAKGIKLITTIGEETTEITSEDYRISEHLPTLVELEDMKKVSFVTGNLTWSTEIWDMADGEYPTLQWNN